MSKVLEINSGNFEKEVLQSDIPVLIDCAADWCGPCKKLAPVIEQLAEELAASVKICHLDVDKSSEIAAQYGILSVPTVMFFKNGQKVDESIGLVPKESLSNQIKALL